MGEFEGGPKFTPIDHIPDGKCLIYIYREEKMKGAASKFRLYANKKFRTIVKSGSYYPYFADPGEIIFSTDPLMAGCLKFTMIGLLEKKDTRKSKKLTIDVEEGKTYYVKLFIKFGGYELVPVSNLEGEREIANCKLSEQQKK
jgi:hypothetical protein